MIEPHPFAEGQRVKLKSDGQDFVYPLAHAGSQGWVRKAFFDRLGTPLIYIEWDKRHWAYNGEEDKTTLAAHFEPVKEKVSKMPNTDDNADFTNTDGNADFMDFMAHAFEEYKKQRESKPEPTPEPKPEASFHLDGHQELMERMLEEARNMAKDPLGSLIDGVPWASRESYQEALKTVLTEALNDEAFLLVTIVRDEDGHLHPTYSNSFTTPESAIMLEAQLTRIGALAHSDTAMSLVNLLRAERKRREDG
jgi:hypothetical protein